MTSNDDIPMVNAADDRARNLDGRKVVVVMMVFAVVMVSAMALYWEFYTRPFRPLQEAIHAEFPDSHPRVIGGRNKSHKPGSPAVLRIVILVDFDPNAATDSTLDAHVRRLSELAAQHLDLSEYAELEIHLVQSVPEEKARRRSFTLELSGAGEPKWPSRT